MIRALIVDDERLARDGLRVRVRDEPDLELVGEAVDGPDAVEKILTLEPDLVFLDVQMPEMDGFEVLERIAGRHLPAIVFVSAHDRFAVRAFDANALDYLLKPFSRERFQETVRRARAELARGEDRDDLPRIAALLDGVQSSRAATPPGPDARPPLARFVVKVLDRFVLLPAREVEWIESAGNYAKLYARGRDFLVRQTMKELTERLDPAQFARVHRTAIVNIERVREIHPDEGGDFVVLLEGGARVRMTRTYRNHLMPR
jgi:two-component system LytT family response regulator